MARFVESSSANTPIRRNAKRPYRAPKLVEFGSVTKLTAENGTILPQDAKADMMMGQGPGDA